MSKKKSYTGIRVFVSILLLIVALGSIAIGALGYLKMYFELELWLAATFAGLGVVVLILWFWFLGVTASIAKSTRKLQS